MIPRNPRARVPLDETAIPGKAGQGRAGREFQIPDPDPSRGRAVTPSDNSRDLGTGMSPGPAPRAAGMIRE